MAQHVGSMFMFLEAIKSLARKSSRLTKVNNNENISTQELLPLNPRSLFAPPTELEVRKYLIYSRAAAKTSVNLGLVSYASYPVLVETCKALSRKSA